MKQASAPGKLFLFGEYAVLHGAPSVLIPVPQRAQVTLADSESELVISQTSESVQLSTQQAMDQMPLLNAVITETGADLQLRNKTLRLDTSSFFTEGKKLGLGSSAALCVALIKLLQPDSSKWLNAATSAHLNFQSGRGSGADIALSMADQPISFSMDAAPQNISLPESLFMLAIWTGIPASTTQFVSGVQNWGDSNLADYDRLINRLHRIADEFLDHLRTKPDPGSLIGLIQEYDQSLEALSTASSVNFYNQPHLALRKRVESARCAYKPSGAGGGDFGIAYSADNNELIKLAEQLNREGVIAFPLWSSNG